MRRSLPSRSAVAVATLSLGALTLSAVPSNAATSSGVTREQVLTAAASVRAAPTPPLSGFPTYGAAANRALRVLVNRVCITDPDGPEIYSFAFASATAAGGSADGLVVSAIISNADEPPTGGTPVGRLCSFGAIATTAERSGLTGTATLAGVAAPSISGDVYVTPTTNSPLDDLFTGGPDGLEALLPTFAASGVSTQTNLTTVPDKKSTKVKKAARVKYDKRIKAAKRAYAKALDKAGRSKTKKAKAKTAYKAARSSAKAKFQDAIKGNKVITTTIPSPFNVSAKFTFPEQP